MKNKLEKIERNMNLAIIESYKALDIDEVPIGAVILKDNKIIDQGTITALNIYKSII